MKVLDINKDKTDLDDIGFGINRLHKRTKEHSTQVCNSCDKLAVKELHYKMGDSDQKITRIERYCQKYFELIINDIREKSKRLNLLQSIG